MAVDMFAKFEGFDGESTDDKHGGWVELEGFDLGLSQPTTGASATGGRTGGRADFQPITLVAPINAATCDLNVYCASGKHIPKVELECCLASDDKHTFFRVEAKNAIVQSSRISCNGDPDAVKPEHVIQLAFGEIKWEYTPIDNEGKAGSSTDRTWSVEKSKLV